MKNVYLVLFAMLISSATFAQKGGSSSNTDIQGEPNGCRDARSSNPTYAYNSIMYNSAISSGYKQAYQLGFYRCKSSSAWQVVNGKLVNTSTTKPSNKVRPCSKDFPGTSSTGPCI